MAKVGILLHVYHLECKDWERLNWGDHEGGLLGTVTKFAEVLLRIPVDDEVVSVIYSGPSQRDGLIEGAYTKRLLMDRIERLGDFERLQTIIAGLTTVERDVFLQRLHDLEVGQVIKNTFDEVKHAAEFVNRDRLADQVLQICAPSHAPRCLKTQLQVRYDGGIDRGQPWYVESSDVCFSGTVIDDVIIIEPPHRGDDPLVGYDPSLASLLKPYPRLATDEKIRLIEAVERVLGGIDKT